MYEYPHTLMHSHSAELVTAEHRKGVEGCGPEAGPFLPVLSHFIVIEPAAKNRKLKT